MEALKTSVRAQQLPTVNQIKSKRSEVQTPDLAPVNDKTSSESTQDPTKNHPRSGNYKDSDVSIEKFFYMGSK